MMKTLTKNLLVAMLTVMAFTACEKDEETVNNPIETGVEVTVRNTFQSAVFSQYPGFEIYANESAYGDTVTNTSSSALEFSQYLGLYDIDLSNNTISYKLVDEAPTGITFRTIEEGTFDRYYISFSAPQAFTSAIADDEFVKVNILSATEIQVVIGAGYSFTSGHSFEITLK